MANIQRVAIWSGRGFMGLLIAAAGVGPESAQSNLSHWFKLFGLDGAAKATADLTFEPAVLWTLGALLLLSFWPWILAKWRSVGVLPAGEAPLSEPLSDRQEVTSNMRVLEIEGTLKQFNKDIGEQKERAAIIERDIRVLSEGAEEVEKLRKDLARVGGVLDKQLTQLDKRVNGRIDATQKDYQNEISRGRLDGMRGTAFLLLWIKAENTYRELASLSREALDAMDGHQTPEHIWGNRFSGRWQNLLCEAAEPFLLQGAEADQALYKAEADPPEGMDLSGYVPEHTMKNIRQVSGVLRLIEERQYSPPYDFNRICDKIACEVSDLQQQLEKDRKQPWITLKPNSTAS